LEELKQGTETIAEWQKHIQIADQSTYLWRTVDAYKKAVLASSEDEEKRWKAVEKYV